MRILRTLVLVAAMGLLCSCDNAADDAPRARELTLAHVLPDTHPVHKGMVRMSELVDEKTNGALTVKVRPSGQLGGEAELIEKVQAGGIQMTKISSNALEAVVPEMGVFALPYLFEDHDHYWRVLEGQIGRDLLDKLEDKGIKGICYYDAGARSFYSKTPITGLSSLKGLKVRVQPSRTMTEAMRALGAEPVQMDYTELTMQLQKGERVTAAENNAPSYWTSSHYKYAPHYYLDRHSRAPDVLVMNLKVWHALPPHDRAELLEAAAESARYQRKLWAEEVEAIHEKLRQNEVIINDEVNTAPLREAVRPLYESLDEDRRFWVDRIRGS